ncbi:MAG TPA: hypothetical protein VGK00_12520 [Anaerolineales bacterium]
MTNKNDPIAMLGLISKKQSEIMLLNIYKGLPISYDAYIKSINTAEIRVLSNRYQLACLHHQGETYIRERDLPFVIRSRVKELDLENEEAVLSGLEIAPENIGNRMGVRVEPAGAMEASLQLKDRQAAITAPISDISTHGATVYLDNGQLAGKQLQVGEDANLTFSLPQVDPLAEIEIHSRGKILAVNPDPLTGRQRLRMRLFFTETDHPAVFQYVSRRQSEIIQDLSRLADEIYQREK